MVKIKIDKKKVIAQYESIRRSGQTNMFDKNIVQQIASKNNFYALVVAIEEDYSSIFKHYSEWIKLIEEKDIPEVYPIKATWKLMNEHEVKSEEKRQLDEHNKWLKQITNGCEHMRSPKIISIPIGLPTCSETGKPCRFDICPKRDTKQKE